MLITPIIKQVRTYCPVFNNRVAGGLDFERIKASAKMALPAAYIVMTADETEDSISENKIIQPLRDTFSVFFELKTGDERGQDRIDDLHKIRALLFLALVGFKPDKDYKSILYDGGNIVDINRGILIYQYNFYADTAIGNGEEPETWEEWELSGLPDLKKIHIDIDVIDPIADPNLKYPGPDSRIEFETDINFDK